MRIKNRLTRLILLLFLPLTLLLSACQTDLAFDVRKDNTYTMTARMVMDAKAGDPNACAEMKNVLANAKDAASEIELKQSKEGDHAVCLLNFREPQPISITSEPFLVIRRNGDYFTAKLPADHTLSFPPNTQFHMTLTFPGNIKSVTGPVPGVVSGKSVTWTQADVLSAGFEVTARASTGLTKAEIFWVVVGSVLLLFILFTVVTYALRKTELGGKVWLWERGWLIPAGVAVADFFLAILDFGYRAWRWLRRRWRHLRVRRNARKAGPGATTSAIPIVHKKPVKTASEKETNHEAAAGGAAAKAWTSAASLTATVRNHLFHGRSNDKPAADSAPQTEMPTAEEIVSTETAALPLKLPVSTLGLYFAEPRAQLETAEIKDALAATEAAAAENSAIESSAANNAAPDNSATDGSVTDSSATGDSAN